MDVTAVNWTAVLAAALSTMVVGALWYSPALFGRAWMNANHLSQEDLKRINPGKVYGVSFLFALAMAANLALFLAGPETTTGWGATAGFLAGFGWVALSVGTIALFEMRSWSYILVNGGYVTLAFTLMGTILGAWR